MPRLYVIALLAGLAQSPDAVEIMRRAIERNDASVKAAHLYTFLEREEEREFDGKGKVKSTESHTYDVTMLEESPYSRLIEKNDKPLPPKEEKKEQEKLQKSIAERQNETESQKAKRKEKREKGREETRKFFREVMDAYDFRLAGEERFEERDLYVIEATPRPGFQPKTSVGKILPKLKGRLWIDKEEFAWVKGEVEVTDTISLGLFLLRVQRGTHMEFASTRVNDEVWLPRRVYMRGAARLALVKKYNVEQESTYKNYRKFQVETKITPVAEKDPPPLP